MGQAEQNELRDNARSWVEHMKGNIPREMGAIVIFLNTKTGDCAIGTNMTSHTGVREVLETMARQVSGSGDNLVVPATSMPKMRGS